MVRAEIVVAVPEGLHARPAAEFVKLAAPASHEVQVSRMGGTLVRGDSMLAILGLGIKHGEMLIIEVKGPNEHELLQSLTAVVSASKTD
jgi:phosphotransferase system HPr (HPr) family protein